MACQIKKKKPAKWKVVIPLVLLAMIGIWYWHEKSFQQLKVSGEDIYFLEYQNKENSTIIYCYDVVKDEVSQIGVLEGYLIECQI